MKTVYETLDAFTVTGVKPGALLKQLPAQLLLHTQLVWITRRSPSWPPVSVKQVSLPRH